MLNWYTPFYRVPTSQYFRITMLVYGKHGRLSGHFVLISYTCLNTCVNGIPTPQTCCQKKKYSRLQLIKPVISGQSVCIFRLWNYFDMKVEGFIFLEPHRNWESIHVLDGVFICPFWLPEKVYLSQKHRLNLLCEAWNDFHVQLETCSSFLCKYISILSSVLYIYPVYLGKVDCNECRVPFIKICSLLVKNK